MIMAERVPGTTMYVLWEIDVFFDTQVGVLSVQKHPLGFGCNNLRRV